MDSASDSFPAAIDSILSVSFHGFNDMHHVPHADMNCRGGVDEDAGDDDSKKHIYSEFCDVRRTLPFHCCYFPVVCHYKHVLHLSEVEQR